MNGPVLLSFFGDVAFDSEEKNNLLQLGMHQK